MAVYLGVNNTSLLTTLLTISASLLPIQTNLLLIKPTNFRAYPILYSGICAESGSGKSPLIKVFINSLSQLQQEEDKRYQTELSISIYEEEYRQWRKSKNTDIDPPVRPKSPREYIITDATSEAIASIQNNQPNNGFLGYFDDILCSLYKKLGTITSSFELSFEAQEVFEQWHKESEELKMAEPKLALLLHCVTNSLNQQEPPKEVQFKTMQSAVQLTEYYIKQVQFIHSDSSDSEENSSSLHFKIIE